MDTEEVDNRFNHCGSSCALNFWRWDISQLTSKQVARPDKYAVLILNRPLTQSPNFIKRVWNNALIRVTVDGGTTQWDTLIKQFPEDVRRKIKQPDLVTGDFDSVTEEMLENYRKKGCQIIHTPDQNCTDFTKALIETNIYSNALGKELDHIIVFSQCSGRIDHMLGNIQTLFLAKTKKLINLNTKLYLLTDDAISWLLSPGEHYISVPLELTKSKRVWCSLVPIGDTCEYVTTKGLKWNLDNQPLKFGDIVSTSNTFDGSDVVSVNCSSTLLWSMRINCIMHE